MIHAFAKFSRFSLMAALLCGGLSGRSAGAEVKPRDTLVYKDGDRVLGRLVVEKDNIIVFQSDRFGELRVPAADAVIIKGEKPVEPAPVPAVAGGPSTPPPAKLAVLEASDEPPPPLDDDVHGRLAEYVAKRQKELGD